MKDGSATAFFFVPWLPERLLILDLQPNLRGLIGTDSMLPSAFIHEGSWALLPVLDQRLITGAGHPRSKAFSKSM